MNPIKWKRVRESTATASQPALLREDVADGDEPTPADSAQTCPRCDGNGISGDGLCPRCEGNGMIVSESTSGPYWVYDDDPEWETLREASRTFSTQVRKKYAASGLALPDGSYPIPDKDALDRAVRSYGHNPTGAVKAHIVKRAKALGATDALPDDWSGGKTKESYTPAELLERIETLETKAEATETSLGVFKALREAKPAAIPPTFSSLSRARTKDGREGYRVVLIREGKGNNQDDQWYTEDAIQEMCESGVCEGMQAYGNHPALSEEEDRPERDVKQVLGTYHDVEFVKEGGKARAEAILVPLTLDATDPHYGWIVTLAEAATRSNAPQPLCGISLYGLSAGDEGERPDGSYGRMVSMVRPSSADIVTNAGAGGGFIRQVMESARALREKSTKELSPMKALEYQTRFRETAKRVREADSDETRSTALAELETLEAEQIDGALDLTVEALRETAPQLVSDIEKAAKAEEGKTIEELQGQLRETQNALGKFNDAYGLTTALREAGVEDSVELRHFAYKARELHLTDAGEIKEMVEAERSYDEQRRKKDSDALRESFGDLSPEDSDVEGAGGRMPAAVLPTDGGTQVLRESGLPIATASAE